LSDQAVCAAAWRGSGPMIDVTGDEGRPFGGYAMMTILGEKRWFCDGVTRRDFLKIGGLALGGMSLTDILGAEARAGVRSSHKAIIMVYLPGGPPHLDMVDMKPDAPSEIRGPYKPGPTNVSGIQISEHMPRMAKMMDKFAIIRSLVGARDEHASNLCLSGYSIAENRTAHHPSLGAVLSKVFGPVERTVPPFVELIPKTQHPPYSNPGDPGFLGLAHSSVRPAGEMMTDMTLRDISLSRLANRRRLLASVDRCRRALDASGTLEQVDAMSQRALDILTSAKFVKALDVTQEDPKVRDRYGRGSGQPITDAAPDWNDQFLVARRLVEAGVRCVTVGFGGWDYHGFFDPKPAEQSARLDQALSALVQDLHDRGLDKDVSVVAWGDFGRTPRMNPGGGRDHWPQVAFALLAGGGMRTGQVIGSTNRFGEYADERPVHYRDVFATLYHNLGIDVGAHSIEDSEGRPQRLLEGHPPIEELV
jgi:uncharacterized protein (DUF1501 family)